MEQTMTLPPTHSTHRSHTNATTEVTRRMVCGGLAGMIAKTVTNPLERVKMLSQTGEHGVNRPSILQIFRTVVQKEGVIGLWAGNGANLLRVFPAKAVVFSSNDSYKKLIRQWLQTDASSPPTPLPGWGSFLAGGMAGMTASACTYPLDFARGRISGKLGHGKGTKTYHGILQTIVLTVKDEGFFAIYRGITPTLLGAIPYEGIKFGTVGLLEALFPVVSSHDDADAVHPMSAGVSQLSTPVRKMLFGGLGGVMAGLLTYPNDTIRRLLQVQGSRGTAHQYRGYWDCALQTYRQHGIRRFYSGLTVNLIRMAPNTALQFYFYALLKQYTEGLFATN